MLCTYNYVYCIKELKGNSNYSTMIPVTYYNTTHVTTLCCIANSYMYITIDLHHYKQNMIDTSNRA